MKKQAVYFDYAAATPLSAAVKTAMEPFFSEHFYNPSAEYGPARSVRAAVDQARSKVAHLLGAKPAEVVFVAGGTEANNLAIRGIMQRYEGANLVISSIEHDSVHEIAKYYDYKVVGVDQAGLIRVDNMQQTIDDTTVLVSVIYANNEFGAIQPIRRIAALIADVRKDRHSRGIKLPIFLHTDAAQASNYLDLHVHRLGVDMMTLNGGKIYGPKQSGALYVKGGMELTPQIIGGGQEYGLRSGTENVPAIIGFAAALSESQSLKAIETIRLKALQNDAAKLLESKIPNAVINGSLKRRLPNNLHITLPGQDNERLQILLDERGLCVATGSACSAKKGQPSRVLGALGLDEEAIRSSLRITFGRQTTEADTQKLIEVLTGLLAKPQK